MPPLPIKSEGVLMERGAKKLGWHPWPAPMAIISQALNGGPGCIACGFCFGNGLRGRSQVEHARHHDPGRGRDGTLRDPPELAT